MTEHLDSPHRVDEIRATVQRKTGLREFYRSRYLAFRDALDTVECDGEVLELGSGGGFLKEIVPAAITSDVISYDGMDRYVDAMSMDFGDQSLKAIFLLNVFHHIPDVGRFFREASRVLRPGGIVFISDQYPGWLSKPILKWAHHEPFDDEVAEWSFPSSGPLSGANGALAWNVFFRDRERFESEFEQLRIERIVPHSPLLYWLSGGLKVWSLVTEASLPATRRLERAMLSVNEKLASFVDIQLRRQA